MYKRQEHTRTLRTHEAAIPTRGPLSVDQFCALKQNANVGLEIAEATRSLSAAQSADAVRQEADFLAVSLPAFDIGELNALLTRHLPNLEAAAAERVQKHFAAIGEGGINAKAQR